MSSKSKEKFQRNLKIIEAYEKYINDGSEPTEFYNTIAAKFGFSSPSSVYVIVRNAGKLIPKKGGSI